jgi:ABC-type nitrate/sulfonate/bicarbonate transport system substrate-binding protein
MSGNADATLLSAEFSQQALQRGFAKLLNAGDFARAISSSVLTTEQRLRERPEEVERFVRAVSKGYRFYAARKEESIQLMMDYLKFKDRGFTEGVYEAYRSGMTSDGTIPEEIIQESVGQARALLKGAAPDREWKSTDFFDFSFAKRAKEELGRMKWVP